MNNNQLIAQRLLQTVGGIPKVVRYKDESEYSAIDLFIGLDRPHSGVTTYSTIGLSNYTIGLKAMNKELRVELIGACESEYTNFGNVLSSCAFNIINDRFSCKPGTIYPNVIREYYEETTMKHVLFTDPFLWENLGDIDMIDTHITWLMPIPISDKEFEFVSKNSVAQLETLFEIGDINIFDLNRDSVV